MLSTSTDKQMLQRLSNNKQSTTPTATNQLLSSIAKNNSLFKTKLQCNTKLITSKIFVSKNCSISKSLKNYIVCQRPIKQSNWAIKLKANILEYILLFVIDCHPKKQSLDTYSHKNLSIDWKSMYYVCKDWNEKLHYFVSNERYYFSRLFFKLYFNSIQKQLQKRFKKRVQKRLTIIFIDWDDTIFPTAYLQYIKALKLKQTNSKKANISMMFDSNPKLKELIKIQVETILQLIFTYGVENIFIVTNAKPHWMIQCMTIFFKNDYKILYDLIFFMYKIQCISARTMTQMFSKKSDSKGIQSPTSKTGERAYARIDAYRNGYHGKTLVFAYILMKYLFKKVNGLYTDVNIINIGDQESIEIEAIKTAMNKIDIFYKNQKTLNVGIQKHLININLLPNPSLETLIIEWKFIRSKVRDFGICNEKYWSIKYEQKKLKKEYIITDEGMKIHQPIILSRHESYE